VGRSCIINRKPGFPSSEPTEIENELTELIELQSWYLSGNFAKIDDNLPIECNLDDESMILGNFCT